MRVSLLLLPHSRPCQTLQQLSSFCRVYAKYRSKDICEVFLNTENASGSVQPVLIAIQVYDEPTIHSSNVEESREWLGLIFTKLCYISLL